ncbi:MAG: type I DNA topoisomerase [Gammaproteobacteria bacterium]|jgi:DNA topoisomerase-1|nr:type I DNA topoisomerase [Gammaproteobacteria bacterium]MBT3858760.1 type I DNA topoisomerase [Gammaproteobacteria bacterium]MBT3986112.1 type I DNA topoisomerase [Gammaproteobacteria bacterium]MBT4581027.1 type I DNA topoisomerase [Gammaproteobacteria bacterium]MBT4659036.1 type I DNA topoisomerase [Gammaproteobacteria bacterium]
MSKSLVIVESPAKAKTINKYLGPEFIVKSSVGHIRDLPTSGSGKPVDPKARAAAAAKTRKMEPEAKAIYKKKKAKQQLVKRMGIDPEQDWAANYQILPGKEKVVSELKKLAKNADHIYLATDLDREGEAIAWHLKESIGGDPARYKRVVFNEITKRAINEAFSEPGELDMRYVEAQQARRFLDRVVGFMVSPLLWAKVARGLSAGRVQSVAVRLVVERERLIRAFIPEEFWEVYAQLKTAKSEKLRCQVVRKAGSNFRPNDKQTTDAALDVLNAADFSVLKREDRPTSSKPKAPLITSTLQQAASTRLGFGVKKTMMMAQRLYEAGYITYMRTDSTHLSNDSIEMCRSYVEKSFGANYLTENPVRYSSKEGAQEAHEAVRPTDVKVLAEKLMGMDPDAVRLYSLIWQFFVACQMSPAKYRSSSITVAAADFELRTKGRIMQFDGYLKVMPSKDEDIVLPDVNEGDVLKLNELEPFQNFTKPTARFTEASLVKELEKQGIGRPSTYASIISTIQDRGYVRTENKRFYALKMGDIVAERLQESFTDLMDYDFTAKMEDSLDEVAAGDSNWKDVLNNFYKGFTNQLAQAEAEDGGMRTNDPTNTDIKCPKCERPMQIRTASTGVFLGCSGYALPPKERCKSTINLTPGEDAIRTDTAEEAEAQENILLRQKHRCGICNTAMDAYLIDEKRKLHVCGNNPDCSGFEVENGEFKIRGYDGPIIECDKCESDMQLKTGRFGKYFGCSNEDCKNTRKLLRNGEAAPPKMDPVPMPELACINVDDHYILRDGASGLFLAASKFPKNRETRAPYVEELLPHKEEIDPKYNFIFEAPVEDDQGNKTMVRYSRKTKEQYVQTEVDKKATGWKAFYDNGKWVITKPVKKAKKKAAAKKKAKKKS